jgi:hypothetical protein
VGENLSRATRRARLRPLVFERDRGLCSDCGLDTEALVRWWERAKAEDEANTVAECSRCAEPAELGALEWPSCLNCGAHRSMVRRTPIAARNSVKVGLLELGFPASLVDNHGATFALWEADHHVPLSENGTDALENLRTLCKPCHIRHTAALAKRRAHAKRVRGRAHRKASKRSRPFRFRR